MRNGDYELIEAPADYPGKRYRGRYCYEHHYVWWKRTGEVIKAPYMIHHKDENKRHNVFSNLERMLKSDHINHHRLPASEIIKHGSLYAYKKGCRCVDCVSTRRAYMKAYNLGH